MSLTLYAHPFAAYCWKVLVALYDNGVPFDYRKVDEPAVHADLRALWPLAKFPVLQEGAVLPGVVSARRPGAGLAGGAKPGAPSRGRQAGGA